jgi:hypothetical protein
VACIFTPSAEDEDVTSTPTSIVDGELEGTRMLKCVVPPIADGQSANVTFEWGSGDEVSLYSRSRGTNTLYSASWYVAGF